MTLEPSLLLFILFFALVVSVDILQRKRRIRALAAQASRLGWRVEKKIDSGTAEALRELPLWHAWGLRPREVRQVLRSPEGLLLFDLIRNKRAQTFVVFESQCLLGPDFESEPRDHRRWSLPLVSSKRATFPQDPAFNEGVGLYGKDHEAIRSFINRNLRDHLLRWKGMHVEFRDGIVALYRHEKLMAPDQLKAFAEEAKDIVQVLQKRCETFTRIAATRCA